MWIRTPLLWRQIECLFVISHCHENKIFFHLSPPPFISLYSPSTKLNKKRWRIVQKKQQSRGKLRRIVRDIWNLGMMVKASFIFTPSSFSHLTRCICMPYACLNYDREPCERENKLLHVTVIVMNSKCVVDWCVLYKIMRWICFKADVMDFWFRRSMICVCVCEREKKRIEM